MSAWRGPGRARLGFAQRRGEFSRRPGARAGFTEHAPDRAAGLAGEEPHHANRGALVEDGEEDRLVVDGRDVDRALRARSEVHAVLMLAVPEGHIRGSAVSSG